MDIATQAVVETATIHVKSANGELLYADAERQKPVQIVIYGPGSEAYGVVEARQSSRTVKRMQENDGKMVLPPSEERRKEVAEDMASLTVAFINFSYSKAPDMQGEPLFKAVYSDPALGFIVRQVNQSVQDWGKFTGE